MQLLKLNDLVRVGRNYDGGYVISESLMRESGILLSFGINDDWSFERGFYKKSGVHCCGFDFSITKTIFLKRAVQQLRFLGGDIFKRGQLESGRLRHAVNYIKLFFVFNRFFARNRFYSLGLDSATHGQFRSLEDILSEYCKGIKNIFLKVDIEGYEYKILDDIIRYKDRFHALAMEVHEIHNEQFDFQTFIDKIEEHYHIYHIHANNYSSLKLKNDFPNVIEISCVRKDMVSEPDYYKDMSHLPLEGIDFPNDILSSDLKW